MESKEKAIRAQEWARVEDLRKRAKMDREVADRAGTEESAMEHLVLASKHEDEATELEHFLKALERL